MALFTSIKERNLWIWALIVSLLIYSSIFLSGLLMDGLKERIRLDRLFFNCFVGMLLIIALGAVFNKKSYHDFWKLIAVLILLVLIILRMGISPAERTHLFEYGLLSVLIYLAIKERNKNIKTNLYPWLLSIILSTGLGIIDEIIQFFIPKRVFDPVDILFNFIASLMTVLGFILILKITPIVQNYIIHLQTGSKKE